jgi:hypothetical protein
VRHLEDGFMARMARKRSRSKKRTRTSEAPPRTVSEGVKVRAVSSSSGRAATTVHVEVEPERIKRQVARFDRVDEVVAEIPCETEGNAVHWDEQRLEKAAEDVRPDGERTLRYTGTRYAGTDVGRHGVGVRLKTPAGTFEAPRSVKAREADKPGDDEHAPADE